MKSLYQFRLLDELKASDSQVRVSDLIGRKEENWGSKKVAFKNETVVLHNGDGSSFELTFCSVANWIMTLHKRWLDENNPPTEKPHNKKTWWSGTKCYITASAEDFIDKDDDNIRTGRQTYTWELVSRGWATYEGKLITKWGIEFPTFESLDTLKKYPTPFPWMQAIVSWDGETYKYNALKKEWTMITTSTPATPALASKESPGIIRVATSNELYKQKTDQWTDGAFLLAPLSYIIAKTEKSLRDDISTNFTLNLNPQGKQAGHIETKSFSLDHGKPFVGWAYYEWTQHVVNWALVNDAFCEVRGRKYSLAGSSFTIPWQTYKITHRWLIPFEWLSIKLWIELLVSSPAVSNMYLTIYHVIY